MNVPEEQVRAGHAAYTRRSLRLYDIVVLGLTNHLIWNCPTKRLLQNYNKHITANHLDVGVGTGYFLDHCRFPSHTAHRLVGHQPELVGFRRPAHCATYPRDISPQCPGTGLHRCREL